MDLSNQSDSSSQGDMIITAGQDTKVKVWMLTDLLNIAENTTNCYHEFDSHTGAVSSVKFSFSAGLQRAFSGSVDKTFRVYDLPGKMILKEIMMTSPISNITVDQLESSAFIACENLNVYQVPLTDQPIDWQSISQSGQQGGPLSTRKRTLTHKKRITAMTLSVDGNQLITGDAGGVIYIWNLAVEGDNSTG